MPIDGSAPPDPAPGPLLPRPPNFDPRTAPVLGTDGHLPAVPASAMSAQAMRQRFKSSPVWSPEVFSEARFSDRSPAFASVLVPLVMRERPTVLLTERTTHMSTHSGQVAFPGGKRDETDTDEAHTALREAQEEIGLAADRIEVLGSMPLYRTGSQFIITPVVALVDPAHTLTINPDEVADAFEVPLDFLMNPAHHRRHFVEWSNARRGWFSMPYMDGSKERFIWGATAAMLRNLYRFLSA